MTKGTASNVAAGCSLFPDWVYVPTYTWTTLGTIPVPNEEMELFFIYARIIRQTTGVVLNVNARAKATIDGVVTYFPSGVSILVCPQAYDDAPVGKQGSDTVVLIIPRSVANLSVEVQVYTTYADSHKAFISSFGQSPHYHR